MSSASAGAPYGYRVVRYGPHKSIPTRASFGATAQIEPLACSGDFILTHSTGFYGRMIRIGEALRYWGNDAKFAHWSHAAIFVDDDGSIVEALGGGVQKRNISVYTDTEYVVVHLPQSTASSDRQQAVAFADFCLHDRYGWLTIVSIALCLLTGSKLSFGVDGQQICSALVARCLERIGVIFVESEPWHLTPADLAKHFKVTLSGERGNVPDRKHGLIDESPLQWPFRSRR